MRTSFLFVLLWQWCVSSYPFVVFNPVILVNESSNISRLQEVGNKRNADNSVSMNQQLSIVSGLINKLLNDKFLSSKVLSFTKSISNVTGENSVNASTNKTKTMPSINDELFIVSNLIDDILGTKKKTFDRSTSNDTTGSFFGNSSVLTQQSNQTGILGASLVAEKSTSRIRSAASYDIKSINDELSVIAKEVNLLTNLIRNNLNAGRTGGGGNSTRIATDSSISNSKLQLGKKSVVKLSILKKYQEMLNANRTMSNKEKNALSNLSHEIHASNILPNKISDNVLPDHSNKITRGQVTDHFLKGQIERVKNKFQRKNHHRAVHKDSKEANLNPYPELFQHRSRQLSTQSNQFNTKIPLENPRIDETVNQGYRNMGFNGLSNRQSENLSERQSQLDRLYYNQAGEEQYKELSHIKQRYGPIEVKHHRQRYNPIADEVKHPRQRYNPIADEVKHPRQRYNPIVDEVKHHRQRYNPIADEVKHRQHYNPNADEVKYHSQQYGPNTDEVKYPSQRYGPIVDEVKHHRQQYGSFDEVNQRQRYDHFNEKHDSQSRIRDEQYNGREGQYKSGDLTGQDPKHEEASVLFQKNMEIINEPLH